MVFTHRLFDSIKAEGSFQVPAEVVLVRIVKLAAYEEGQSRDPRSNWRRKQRDEVLKFKMNRPQRPVEPTVY